jgi:hypothetical protein
MTPKKLSFSELRGAVARGWCSPENSNKEMDAVLAEAVSVEVWKALYPDAEPASQ